MLISWPADSAQEMQIRLYVIISKLYFISTELRSPHKSLHTQPHTLTSSKSKETLQGALLCYHGFVGDMMVWHLARKTSVRLPGKNAEADPAWQRTREDSKCVCMVVIFVDKFLRLNSNGAAKVKETNFRIW